jgi:hypothetical protein
LIEGKDPDMVGPDGRGGRWDQCVSDVILSRMRSDYNDTWAEYAFCDIGGLRELLPWENKLPSSMMNIMTKNCFKFGMKAEFEKWLADGHATDFERQIFTRKDLQYWLDTNRFLSRYQFEKRKTSAPDVLEESTATSEDKYFPALLSQQISQVDKDKPLTTTERNTLLKLVIGMAIKGYSHDPAASKSTAPKEIADDLADLGMTITDDTVRKYLKQAVVNVLPAKRRQQ